MRTQIEGVSVKDIFKETTLAGWLLLARPLVFLLFSRRRSLDQYASVDGSAIVFMIYAFACFYVGYIEVFQKSNNIGRDVLFRSPIVWFLVYTIWGAVSTIWSVTPTLTLFRSFECFANMLMICAIIQQLFEKGSWRYTMLWSLFYATWDCFWCAVPIMRYTTDFGTIMLAAQFTGTTFFFMALYFTPRYWYNWFIIVMSFFSVSTVAYIGMALGMVSAFWIQGKIKALVKVGAVVLLICVILIGPYTILKNTVFFDKDDISIEETSGRDHLKDAAVETIENNPLTGLGFFAAEPYVFYAKHLGGISAHNSFFSAGMGLGYPGMAMMAIFFLAMGFCVFSRYIDPKVKPILIGCYSVAFLHCMGNPSLGSRVFAAWLPNAYIFILTCYFYIYGKYYSEGQENNEENEDYKTE